MYQTFTAADYRRHINLPDDYTIDGFIVYGTYKSYPYDQFEESIQRLGYEYKKTKLQHEFFGLLREFEINGQKYWLAVAYGGALLSEYMHLAGLFGSKHNILIGSCGGLKKGLTTQSLIVPEWSYAEESSAKAYQPDANRHYASDKALSDTLAGALSSSHDVHRGPTVTYQAMLAETWEDVQTWSNEGFVGVEMEAATVFAASKHFGVPAAAVIHVDDNLIEEETIMTANYDQTKEKRRQISQDTFDVVTKTIVTGHED